MLIAIVSVCSSNTYRRPTLGTIGHQAFIHKNVAADSGSSSATFIPHIVRIAALSTRNDTSGRVRQHSAQHTHAAIADTITVAITAIADPISAIRTVGAADTTSATNATGTADSTAGAPGSAAASLAARDRTNIVLDISMRTTNCTVSAPTGGNIPRQRPTPSCPSSTCVS